MPKKCQADSCTWNVFADRYCKKHQYLRPAKESKESKFHQYLKKDSAEYQAAVNQQSDESQMEVWFQKKINKVRQNPICEECGAKISDEKYGRKTDQFFRASVSHIFGKADFPSVKTEDENEMILCAANGCHSRSEKFEDLKDMKVYPKVLAKVRLFIHLVKETHKKRYKEFANALLHEKREA